jgi:N-acetylneuraminate synthase
MVVMHCVSKYPCPPEDVGLNVMPKMSGRYKFPIGYSCHAGNIFPTLIAASAGVRFAEIHVCWHRDCFGADVPASITIDELRQLVQGVRFIERMTPVDKDEQAKSMEPMRRLFRV